ncbi:hypothetical protein PsorP6_006963 [Peronosclerospora sorghi]|uniref:Uncharacterized protein n=1 Tax=Peronosclerospora sorghi TaxID=230839 RepID=A0ACC0WAL1_9STRA|nr:hypothetical protein PsorP6_006963 [Peronosclerospora sorghi]
MLQQTNDQIYELQVTIENLNADLKLADRKTARSTIHCREDDHQETKRRKRIISLDRENLDKTEKLLGQMTADNDILREKIASEMEGNINESSVPSCSAHDTFTQVLIQVRCSQ